MRALFFTLGILTANPDPYAIYHAALKQLAALAQPPFIDEISRWTVTVNGAEEPPTPNRRGLFRSSDRSECVFYEPYHPTDRVTIGASYFAPDVWLVRGEKTAAAANANFAPDLGDLKTIAAVRAVAPPAYDISLAGVSRAADGHAIYHLTLKPRFDPVKHNLRELWIDAATYNLLRARVLGSYQVKGHPEEPSMAVEDFGAVGPYWLVTHVQWEYDVPFGARVVVDVAALRMSFPDAIPDWYFDERAFARHRNDVAPFGALSGG